MKPFTLRIDLGVSAQQIIQQLKIYNQDLEQQITEGIELGLQELVDHEDFKRLIADQTKREILDMINKSVIKWDIRQSFRSSIEEKLAAKIQGHADKLVEQLTENWK